MVVIGGANCISSRSLAFHVAGMPDILIANAGASRKRISPIKTAEEWDRILAVVSPARFTIQAAARLMRRQFSRRGGDAARPPGYRILECYNPVILLDIRKGIRHELHVAKTRAEQLPGSASNRKGWLGSRFWDLTVIVT